jgi:hypothetical protein
MTYLTRITDDEVYRYSKVQIKSDEITMRLSLGEYL